MISVKEIRRISDAATGLTEDELFDEMINGYDEYLRQQASRGWKWARVWFYTAFRLAKVSDYGKLDCPVMVERAKERFRKAGYTVTEDHKGTIISWE